MNSRIRHFARCAAMLVWAWSPAAAFAAQDVDQRYPARPLHLIVPQAPGGHSDVLGRIVAERLAEILKQPVLVENRGGVGGTIGAEAVAHANADGYTLLFAGTNNLTLAPLLLRSLHYRVSDFAPVGAIARVSYGLAVHPRLPVRTMAELVDYVRAHPGELNYGSSGVGSTSSLIFELLKRQADIDIVHIPFRGSAVAVNEIVGGRIDMVFTDLAALQPLAERGAVRLVAVAGPERSASAPDVPTVEEQGYPQLAIAPWYGIVVPAGTPRAIVAVLSDALRKTLRKPELRERFNRLGFVAIEATPEQVQDMIRAELGTYRSLIEQAGIEPPN